MTDSEKLMALKKAYVDIILNTAKEAAVWIMVSERKTLQYQQELFTAKEEALRMLLKLKQMLHSKYSSCSLPQMEYSLWSSEIEDDIIPLSRELGIGIVAYSPLGHGFFGGKATAKSLPTHSILPMHPRFTGDNLEKNKSIYDCFANLAAERSCTPPQLALAWILHQVEDIIPITGTTKVKNLDNNIQSLALKLTQEGLREISDTVPIGEVGSEREFTNLSDLGYNFANTPRK